MTPRTVPRHRAVVVSLQLGTRIDPAAARALWRLLFNPGDTGERHNVITHRELQAPPPSPHLALFDSAGDRPVVESLLVTGRADTLDELVAVVDRLGEGD